MRQQKLLVLLFVAMALPGLLVSGCSKSDSGGEDKIAPSAPAVPSREESCDDGADDDQDGQTDCADRDCARADVCQVARCKEVCAAIGECDDIMDACSDKELKGVVGGCQASCTDEGTRGQVMMADGVPCMIIGSVFLDQVRKSGICLEEEDSEAGTS